MSGLAEEATASGWRTSRINVGTLGRPHCKVVPEAEAKRVISCWTLAVQLRLANWRIGVHHLTRGPSLALTGCGNYNMLNMTYSQVLAPWCIRFLTSFTSSREAPVEQFPSLRVGAAATVSSPVTFRHITGAKVHCPHLGTPAVATRTYPTQSSPSLQSRQLSSVSFQRAQLLRQLAYITSSSTSTTLHNRHLPFQCQSHRDSLPTKRTWPHT